MTLTANQKKWKKYIEEKLKKARMGKIMRRNSELLALMIAATIKMYTDVDFSLSNMAESMKDIMDDPAFKRLASDPRAVAEYLQSPGTVIKASQHMKHRFLESIEQSEHFMQGWQEEDDHLKYEAPQYVDLDDGTKLKIDTSKELGEDWVNVSREKEEKPLEKKKDTPEQEPLKKETSKEEKSEKETPKKKEETPEKETEEEPEPEKEEDVEKELEKNDWVISF